MATLLHVDIVVRDIAKALPFWVDALGYVIVEDAEIHGPIAEFYSRGRAASMRIVLLQPPNALFGARIELMQFPPGPDGAELDVLYGSEGKVPSIWNVTLLVDDIDATLGKLGAIGAKPSSAPFEIDLPKSGKAKLVFVRDLEGNLVELVEKRKNPGPARE